MPHQQEHLEASPHWVVVHSGARDNYQVALALNRAGLLYAIVTDVLFSKQEAPRWLRLLPGSVRKLLRPRTAVLPASRIRLCPWTGLLATLLERVPHVSFQLRRVVRRFSDGRLGRTAGRLAVRSGSGLLSYSYYGTAAFRAYGRNAVLFQVHPHPLTTRRLLQEELQLHPECTTSLQQEWELALPAHDLQNLIDESQSASAYLVASTFTRDSLVEHGISSDHICVVPYGVDLVRFHPPVEERSASGPLKLLFVGRINQRKGIAYLLRALDQLKDVDVHLTICGRVVDDLELFRTFADRITIRPSVSEEALIAAYQQADLFVFPSVAEGFGQVLLEALACGLPILATTHTAASDLIEHSRQGWIVEPRDVRELAGRIRWAANHREELRHMGFAARQRAEQFTWDRFQKAVSDFVLQQPFSPVGYSRQ